MSDTEQADPAAPVPTIVPPGDVELHVGDPVVEIEPAGPGVGTGANPVYGWATYVSHKIVNATPIVEITPATAETLPVLWVKPIADGDQVEFQPTEPAMRSRAEVGGYAVVYANGFRSVSPKAAFEDGYLPLGPPPAQMESMAAQADARLGQTAPPLLGVLIHDMGDGTAGIHAIEPDGTEHAITMPTAHGALIAFMDLIRNRLPELGSRATAWTVKKPGDDDGEAQPAA